MRRLLAVVCFAASGCVGPSPTARTIPQDSANAYALIRGTFRVTIEPAKRRIMWLGVDGSNLLYVNPAAKPGKSGEHVAWGGEKAWLWPQDRWREGKSNWPPPMDVEGLAYSVESFGASDGLICTYSADGAGGEIKRQYTVDRDNRLLVRSSLLPRPKEGIGSAQGWGLWTVAQIQRPARLYARIVPRALPTATPLPPFGADRMLSVTSAGDDFVEVGIGGDAPRKVGLEADRFVAWYPDGTVLRVEQLPSPPGAPPYRPGERSQVYSNPATPADPSYVELEFTAPLTPAGRPPLPLNVCYSVHQASSPEDAIRLLDD